MRRLKTVVDLTAFILYQQRLSLAEATRLIEATRNYVLHLFPDKWGTFDLIYRPRFQRILEEKGMN